jgi:hypothetical protein
VTAENPESPEAVAARVRESLGPVLVGDLAPHVARGVVVGCAPELDLVTCGVAVAQDDAATVGAWLRDGALWRLAPDDPEALALSEGEVWWAAVVRPFVLVQRRPAS